LQTAFCLVLEGFTPHWIADAAPVFASTSTFNSSNIVGLFISINAVKPVEYELGGPESPYADVVQSIRFAYDVTFTNTSSFPLSGSKQTYTLSGSLSVGGSMLSWQPQTNFTLLGDVAPAA
jgi:hypothetical protein